MDRYWLLTNTCYGNWLPGDRRGFVGQVWEHRQGDAEAPRRVRHDVPGEEYDKDVSGLERASREQMRGPPVYLTAVQARRLLTQFQETATHRRCATQASRPQILEVVSRAKMDAHVGLTPRRSP